ncbi:DNA/RNA polymerase [Venturia nashicola]|uniref:DNA-directed RNA polymerase n=1 Tax=Venturia nashicola TaxID=86259 RepID=A0A4Z1PIZ3_9PEZI|nr:DNA/RNA polymerase [Venturia nashicola]
MLAAAKRKLKPRSTTSKQLDAAFQQLNLPWLCPAQTRRAASLTPCAQSLDLSRHHPRPLATRTPAASRFLATATTDYFGPSTAGDNIPFIASQYPPHHSPTRISDRPGSAIRPWSSTSAIVINDSISTPPIAVRTNRLGIGGDGSELLSNLHTCLTVGRFERAESIIRRLAKLYVPTATEILLAHNLYLRSLLDSLMLGRGNYSPRKIQQWFEVEMRQAGVSPDATTYAILCRLAMVTLSGGSRDRTIRRHLHHAEEAGLLNETMSSGEFHEDEWLELFRIREDIYAQSQIEAVEAEIAVADPPKVTSSAPTPQQPRLIDLDIKPVQQKGAGLSSLKSTLANVHNFNPSLLQASTSPDQSDEDRHQAILYARQIHLEEAVVDSTIERWKSENESMLKLGINPALQRKSIGAMMWEWHADLESGVKEELKAIKAMLDKPESMQREEMESTMLELGPYLEQVPPERMAAITILTVFHYLSQFSNEGPMVLSRLTSKLGRVLESEASTQGYINKERHLGRLSARSKRARILSKIHGAQEPMQGPDTSTGERPMYDNYARWPMHIKHRVAALMLSKLVDKVKILVTDNQGKEGEKGKRRNPPQKEPAFRHSVDSAGGRRVGNIHPHEALTNMMGRVPSRNAIGLSGHLPMLVEPLPWRGFKAGGYIRYPGQFMRAKDGDTIQEMYSRAAIEKGDMDQVFAGLDVLGRAAWNINTPILEIMVEVWNSGEALADIPPLNVEIVYPPEPDSSADGLARYLWRKEVERLDNERMGLHSQRCFQNLQLETAKAFANETFYFPHNIDFRGRAYPLPPFLNHMGADGCRGLLRFAKGRVLGPEGLRWLKIHLANVFGNNKSTLSQREQFATDHLDDIYDSVSKPLTGKRWWLQGEDPWQVLATCFEIHNALESGDPETFLSHMPVHQDGTCNGLQHYAALGGDKIGAAQVNLEPGDRPADIYSGVADLVRSSIHADAEDGNELALLLKDKVTRKLVKQTVMTNVYGVTFVGARAQVQKQLDDAMPHSQTNSVKGKRTNNGPLASYVAKKIFKALAAMFQGAHAIQYWLGECANRISTLVTPEQIALIKAKADGKAASIGKSKYTKQAIASNEKSFDGRHFQVTDFKSSVVWTTPLKLPVVQPYRASRQREIKTSLQNITLRESRPGDPIAKRKQQQAFPPNFVHSLDATHMLLSALKCDELGLTFAAVHDSYWTHAADVPVMNAVLRDCFVSMHEEDIIGRLAAEFKVRYKDSMRLATVYASSPVGKQILQHRANKGLLKSNTRRTGGAFTAELLEEWERQQLLKSDDPAEVEKGKAMVTTASIFESVEDAEQFRPPPEDIDAVAEVIGPDGIPNDAALEKVLNEEMPELEDTDVRDDVVDNMPEEAEGLGAAQKIAARGRKQAPVKHVPKTFVWVALQFPEVPKKGDFDVSRVKESTYFFS